MRKRRKILSLLLCMTLAISMMPMTVFAADTGKVIQFVDSGNPTGGISGYDGAAGDDYIYYGNWTAPDKYTTSGPIKWRVLDMKTNMENAAEGDGLFLLSENLLGTGTNGDVYFDREYSNGKAWQGSDAQAWCKDFAGIEGNSVANAFSTAELGAIQETSKDDGPYETKDTYPTSFKQADRILNGDKVFFLSAEEAETYFTAGESGNSDRVAYYNGSAGVWWLRSPSADAYGMDYVGVVPDTGRVYIDNVGFDNAVRPAFNLDLNSVLFTSAAESGKSASGMDAGLAAVSEYAGNEWKLTLLDKDRNFTISDVTTNGSGTIAFSYSGAQTGENEYISAAIVESGAITHYGRILQLDGTENDKSGTASLTLPAGVTLRDTTKLYVFNEQYNGGASDDTKLTDYASNLIEVNVDTTAPTLTAGSASRESDTTATVKFTSSKAGTYYYSVVDSGEAEPEVDTSETGTACDTAEQIISLTSLTAGAKDIYIVVKDAAGNISDKQKIEIPAYVAPSYSISANPPALDFGSATVGYSSVPAAQTVTITNTGNQTITLKQPMATDFNIGTLSTTELMAGGTATFTVQPKTGLSVGSHNEMFTISGSNDISTSVILSFTVTDSAPPAPPIVITYYDITAEQPEHGTITLERDRIYRYGDVDVTLMPDEGYEVKDLLINGVSVGAVSSYTIEDVTGDIHVTAVFGETEAAKNARIAKGVENTTIRMYYKKDEIGKGWIKLHYRKSFGFKVDNYEIFRSVKKNTSFGEKPFFVTKKNKVSGFYRNTKNVKKGVRHYYKMRGVREIAGETYYTQWSNLVMRTGR